MPSKDTVVKRISKKTEKELLRIKESISKDLGIPLEKITFKDAEAVLRLKAKRGKVMIDEIQDILIGKIKV